jgi:hypothetical protein
LSSETLIEEYLLGCLNEEDRERIEQRILVDPSFFEQAMIVEQDLLDAYVDGKLSESKDFIELILSTPQQRQKLLTATALRRYISEIDKNRFESNAILESKYTTAKSWLRRFLMGTTNHPRIIEVDLT